VLERTLYNAVLAGIDLNGKRFIVAEPLESTGRQQRRDWPAGSNTAAPINLARLLASVPGYFYATKNDSVYVNLYAAGTANIKLDSGPRVKFVQETKYPWDGAVKLTVNPEKRADFWLNLRIPGWAQDAAVPSDLYDFVGKSAEPVTLKINGEIVNPLPKVNGYACLNRQWNPGDVVELNLPMPVRRIVASDKVVDARQRVALQRGPIVYCLDAANNENAKVRNLVLPDDARLEAKFEPRLLGGVVAVTTTASALRLDEDDKLSHTAQTVVATPYYTWGNRDSGEMLVWIPNTDAAAVPTASPNLAASAKITASPKRSGQAVDGRAAKDAIEPRSSHDNTPLSHFDWWPDRSVTQWCQYTWDEPITISQTQIYWWDDSTTGGGCKVPVSWKAFYKDGDNWTPVETTDDFEVAADRYNKVKFKPVTTTALRLEIVIRSDASMGIQEWKVR